jgi:hypothetical protein
LISLKLFGFKRDSRLAGPEGVSDEAGEEMDYGVHPGPVA